MIRCISVLSDISELTVLADMSEHGAGLKLRKVKPPIFSPVPEEFSMLADDSEHDTAEDGSDLEVTVRNTFWGYEGMRCSGRSVLSADIDALGHGSAPSGWPGSSHDFFEDFGEKRNADVGRWAEEMSEASAKARQSPERSGALQVGQGDLQRRDRRRQRRQRRCRGCGSQA